MQKVVSPLANEKNDGFATKLVMLIAAPVNVSD